MSVIYVSFGNIPWIYAMFNGLKPAVIAIVILALQENKKIKEILSLVTAAVVGVVLNLTFYLGKAVIFPEGFELAGLDYFSIAWVIISFFAMYRFKINMITWIGISAVYGLIIFLI